jgi:hypothetical protein
MLSLFRPPLVQDINSSYNTCNSGGPTQWQKEESTAGHSSMNEVLSDAFYAEHVSRRNALSKWLEEAVADRVAADNSENYLLRLFSLLSGLQNADAVRLVEYPPYDYPP